MALSAIAARRLARQRESSAKEESSSALDKPIFQTELEAKADITTARHDEDATQITHVKRNGRKRRRPTASSRSEPRNQKINSRAHKPSAATQQSIAGLNGSSDRQNHNSVPEDDELNQIRVSEEAEDTISVSDDVKQRNQSKTDVSGDSEHFSELETDSSDITDICLSSISATAINDDYIYNEKSSTIQILPEQSVVCIGQYDLWVRQGSVSLLGAILHASSKVYRVTSPSCHSLPVIRGLQDPRTTEETTSEIVLINCSSGIKALRKLNPKFGRLWNGTSDSYQILQSTSDDTLRRPLTAVHETGRWQALVKQLIDHRQQNAPVVAVCGPKGSGKSTFSRFLCNALISTAKWDQVAFLDIDPGQPEYSNCGDLSLLLLGEFNLGPAFSHPNINAGRNERVWTHYFGFITPRDDPHHYVSCVADLYNRYRKDYDQLPLVVNFSGWILGGGSESLETITNILKPTDIVYMSTDGPEEVLHVLKASASKTSSKIHTMVSNPHRGSSRSPADLRLMQTISYFHTVPGEKASSLWNSLPICELPVQRLSWASPDKCFDGIVMYCEDMKRELLGNLVEASIMSAVLVHQDKDLEEALGDDEILGMTEYSQVNETYWRDSRTENDPAIEGEIDEPNSEITRRPGIIWRTNNGPPYYLPRQGSYQPLSPSRSCAVGQVYVKHIDYKEKVLHVVTPLVLETIHRRRAQGARLLLVRGRIDAATWATLEPYYAGMAQERELQRTESYISHGEDNEREVIEESSIFDLAKWAEATEKVQLVDKKDTEMRRRMKPWRTRRNLETSSGREK